jgi:Ribosomal protein L11, RNA binding domain
MERLDASFDIQLRTPLSSAFLREAASIARGAASPNGKPVGILMCQQPRTIAETKMPDLNAGSMEVAMKVVEGTQHRHLGERLTGSGVRCESPRKGFLVDGWLHEPGGTGRRGLLPSPPKSVASADEDPLAKRQHV